MLDDDFYGRHEAAQDYRNADPREPSDFVVGDEPDKSIRPSPAQRDLIGECFAAFDRAWGERQARRVEAGGMDEDPADLAYSDARETAGLD